MENNLHTTELLEQKNIYKNEFVPYEQALELKNLGFQGYTFAIFGSDGNIALPNEDYPIMKEEYCKAPTFSQAFKWFREKYNLFGCIDLQPAHWFVRIDDKIKNHYLLRFETYEEAELACLKKLIELVKTKK